MTHFTPHRWQRVSQAFAVLAALPLFGAVALADEAPTPKAPVVSPLTTAKSFQVQEKFSVGNQTGKITPLFDIVAQIVQPNKVRLDVTSLTAGPKVPSKKSLYLSDGKQEWEVNGFTGQYTVKDAPPAGELPHSQLGDMAGLAVIYNAIKPSAPKSGYTRTTAKETLEGHDYSVMTETQPARKGNNGNSFVISEKVWTDAKTGLPFRRTQYVTQNGKQTPILQVDYLSWSFDKPIAADQFAFVAPAWAKPYEEPKLLAEGSPAPDFAAIAPDGKTVHLSDFKGKTVVIDFWATWCGPCQASMPHLEKVYQQVKDKNVVVLAVCVWDTKEEYVKWVAAKKKTYSFPTFFDPAGRGEKSIAGSLYKVTGIPTQYVIDKEGKVASYSVGYTEGEHNLETSLAKLGINVTVEKKSASAK